MTLSWFLKRHQNVYLYVPNLIGYARLICALYAFYIAKLHPYQCVLFYSVAFVCDDLDGRCARLLNQTSVMGIVLDMVTDRLSTAGLFVLLSMIYQEWFFLFLLLLMLDISSHWAQMYYVLSTGKTTHKEVTSKSWLVRSYYRYRIFMGICCISCEVLYLSLYLMHWVGLPDVRYVYSEVSIFGSFVSLPTSVLVVKVPIVFWIALLAFPGFLMKQVINVFQLKNAMVGIVRYEAHNNNNSQNKVH